MLLIVPANIGKAQATVSITPPAAHFPLRYDTDE